MNELELKHIIEATLLAAGKPVTTQQFLELFDERERPTEDAVKEAFAALATEYENRGIEVIEVASGWRIQVRQRAAEIVSRLWSERPTKYSRALLETLALIAYRQPITRSEIEEIRGVAVSSTIMRTLQERNWIRTVGHREVPGRPELVGTTREFLDYFGLKSLDQLPTLAELKDIETIGVQLELPADQAPVPEGEAAAEGTVAQNTEGATDVATEVAATAESAEATTASAEEVVSDAASDSTESETEDADDDLDDDDADDDLEDDDSDDDDDEDDDEAAEGEDDEISADAGDADTDASNDDSELSADAEDGDEDSDVSPMVASDEDEERGRIGEPARED